MKFIPKTNSLKLYLVCLTVLAITIFLYWQWNHAYLWMRIAFSASFLGLFVAMFLYFREQLHKKKTKK